MTGMQSFRFGARWQGSWGVLQVACEIPINERSGNLSRQSRGLKPDSENSVAYSSLPAPRSGARMLPPPEYK
jgi:hypothetical protein